MFKIIINEINDSIENFSLILLELKRKIEKIMFRKVCKKLDKNIKDLEELKKTIENCDIIMKEHEKRIQELKKKN